MGAGSGAGGRAGWQGRLLAGVAEPRQWAIALATQEVARASVLVAARGTRPSHRKKFLPATNG